MKQFEGVCLTKEKKITLHYMRYTIILYDPPKIMEVKTDLNISSIKLPVTQRFKPPYLTYIYMVEKYAYSRGVIHSLTNTASLVGVPSMLKLEFRSLIR